jgi:exodeoxyribonuclease X
VFAVLDVETTGVEGYDQVVEIGVVFLGRAGRLSWSTLVRPTVAVHPSARGAHHISEEELAAAPTVEEVLRDAPRRPLRESVMVAHNLAFDARMMGQTGLGDLLPERRICTYQCARHVWPQAPSHSNQALRYHLNLRVPSALGSPHRAVADATVTASLLEALLAKLSAEDLERLTSQPVLLEKVRVGKYRGQPWSEMDRGYLEWILNCKEPFDDDVQHTARHWLRTRYGIKKT